jgi:large subunit ribosomal protein L22
MEFKTTQKYLIESPRKLREVAVMISKLTPQDAVERLPFVKKKDAGVIKKVILTAIANAKQKNIEVGNLIFKEIQINEGPRLKRFRAGARGRAKPYKKKMSHIRVVLTTRNDQILNPKSQIKNSDKPEVKSEVEDKKGKKNVK